MTCTVIPSMRHAVEELQPGCINNLASLMHLRWAINRAGPALEGTSAAAAAAETCRLWNVEQVEQVKLEQVWRARVRLNAGRAAACEVMQHAQRG